MSTNPYDLRTVNYSTVIPAIPGTTVIHYNGYHDSTQEEAVIFWGVGVEDEGADAFPCVKPFVLNLHGGFASPLDFVEGGHDGRESEIIGFNIPGWGFMAHCKTSAVYGDYLRQVKGYDPTLGEPKSRPYGTYAKRRAATEEPKPARPFIPNTL